MIDEVESIPEELAKVLIPYEGKEKFQEKLDARLRIIERMLPRIELANSTRDPETLLQIAAELEVATLHYLADKYRQRAGTKPAEEKQRLCDKALAIINERGRVSPQELQEALGLTRRVWFGIAARLRKSGKVVMANRTYLPRSLFLLDVGEEPVMKHVHAVRCAEKQDGENATQEKMVL